MADDELDDRLSRRFDTSQSDETDEEDDEAQTSQSEETEQQSQTSQNNMSSAPSQNDRNAQGSQKTTNIKEEWNVRSIYLSDDLDSRVSTAYKRLDLDFSEADSDIDLQKTRHFYPLLVRLGLERLEEMDVTEVTEQLESKDSV